MTVWAIADLHLSFGVPDKKMDVFGDRWVGYTEKLKQNWCAKIKPEDLVLIAGDISWAMKTEDARLDLAWIDQLPGTKVIIRGNHDYWWQSLSKIQKILPPSIHLIQNNVFNWNEISIAGARLWDTQDYGFKEYIDYVENPRVKKLLMEEGHLEEAQAIFERELLRLEMSLKALRKEAKVKIAMTHYPPISGDLKPSRVSDLLESYGVTLCVFGHLHNVRRNSELFGIKNGIHYYLTSCDYLDNNPICIM